MLLKPCEDKNVSARKKIYEEEPNENFRMKKYNN